MNINLRETVTKGDSQCFLGSLGVTGTDLRVSLNWRLQIWVQPGLEPVLRNCAPGSHWGDWWGDWSVPPAAQAPEEPEEEWKAEKVERWDVTSSDEENRLRPLQACSPGCGRCCSALGCPLCGTGPLLERSGSVEGRGSNLTVGLRETAAGGGSLEKRASPGSQEG